MTLSPVAIACTLLLWGDAPPDPARSPALLPRSSIDAVIAARGELGLTDAEVRALGERDEALQKQLAEIREQGSAAGPHPATGGSRGGRGGRGRSGGRSAPAAQDPGARARALQSRLDDADTAAWLSAEGVLTESRREKAREVAEKYREALADQRDAERAGQGGSHR